MSGKDAVKPEDKTLVQQLDESVKALAAKEVEANDLRAKLTAAEQTIAEQKTSMATLTSEVETARKAQTDAEAAQKEAAGRADTEKARADKAEKARALDPDHIDVSGRKTAVHEGSEAGGDGQSELAQWRALKTSGNKRAARKFFAEHKDAILEQGRQEKDTKKD